MLPELQELVFWYLQDLAANHFYSVLYSYPSAKNIFPKHWFQAAADLNEPLLFYHNYKLLVAVVVSKHLAVYISNSKNDDNRSTVAGNEIQNILFEYQKVTFLSFQYNDVIGTRLRAVIWKPALARSILLTLLYIFSPADLVKLYINGNESFNRFSISLSLQSSFFATSWLHIWRWKTISFVIPHWF